MRPLQSQAEARRKLLAAARLARPAFAGNGRRLPPAFFVTDPARTPDPVSLADRLPPGWGVIYRHFGAADRFKVGARLRAACSDRRLILLVSADADLARAIRADGVHWPEQRLAAVRSRHPRWIETASAHSWPGLVRARRLGADAALLSSVFASNSPSAACAIGAHRFRDLAARAGLPVYALGGVTPETAAQVFAAAHTRTAGWASLEAVMSGWGNQREG